MQHQTQQTQRLERPPPPSPANGRKARGPARSAALHAGIIPSAFDAIIAIDLDGTIRAWNPAAERLYGHTEAEVLGAPATILVPPESFDEFAAACRRAQDDLFPRTMETVRTARGGRPVSVLTRIVPIHDDEDHVVGVACIDRDAVTRIPLRSHARLLADLPHPACLVDADGSFRAVNPAWQKAFGWGLPDLAGLHFLSLVHPEEARRAAHAFQAPRGATTSEFTARYRCKDGLDRPFEWSVGVVARTRLLILTARNPSPTEAAARDQLKQWQARDAQRRQLMSSIVHELAGPVTPLKIQSHVLQRILPEGDTRVAEALRILSSELEHLQRLVEDLADLARGETDALRLEVRRLEIASLVHEVAGSVQDDGVFHGVTVRADAPSRLFVVADAGRVRQVLHNLVRNALKFTPRGGGVTIRATQTEKGVLVAVEDTGRGLRLDAVGKLFQPFTQVHDSGEAAEQGSGLGLYVSRGIIEMHGGRIWAESEGLGKGAVFSFILPAEQADRRVRGRLSVVKRGHTQALHRLPGLGDPHYPTKRACHP